MKTTQFVCLTNSKSPNEKSQKARTPEPKGLQEVKMLCKNSKGYFHSKKTPRYHFFENFTTDVYLKKTMLFWKTLPQKSLFWMGFGAASDHED